jgi:predicted HicB family RNase H-like nuclease
MSVRLDEDLHNQIGSEAGRRNVTLNWLINQMLREGVDRLREPDTFTVLL